MQSVFSSVFFLFLRKPAQKKLFRQRKPWMKNCVIITIHIGFRDPSGKIHVARCQAVIRMPAARISQGIKGWKCGRDVRGRCGPHFYESAYNSLNAKLHMVLTEAFFQTDGNVIFIHCFSSWIVLTGTALRREFSEIQSADLRVSRQYPVLRCTFSNSTSW